MQYCVCARTHVYPCMYVNTQTYAHAHTCTYIHAHIAAITFPPETVPETAAGPRFSVFVMLESSIGRRPPAKSDNFHSDFTLART